MIGGRVDIKKYKAQERKMNNLEIRPPGVKRRSGTKFIKAFPKSEPIVSMLPHNGKIYLATTRHVYLLEKEKVTPLNIKKKE